MGTLWEEIEQNTKRMKVFGGWIVLHLHQQNEWLYDGGEPACESMVFVPDPNHEWVLKTDPIDIPLRELVPVYWAKPE